METEQGGMPQIDAMRAGVDYSFTVKLRKFEYTLRPLSNKETMKCYQDVEQHMLTMPQWARTDIARDNSRAKEFLKAASSPFGMYAPQISEPMLEAMTNDEIMFCYKEWLAVCDKVNPSLEKMSEGAVKELVETVKKNPPADLEFQLIGLSFSQLKDIALYLLTMPDGPTDK